MTILYVDDDKEDIEIFGDAVHAVDPTINYLSASSGQEALEYLKDAVRLPDYLILDINMPGMDGKTVLELLRKEERFNNMNVLIYSTNSFPQDIDEIEALGSSFIKKANSFHDLCAIIRKLACNQ